MLAKKRAGAFRQSRLRLGLGIAPTRTATACCIRSRCFSMTFTLLRALDMSYRGTYGRRAGCVKITTVFSSR